MKIFDINNINCMSCKKFTRLFGSKIYVFWASESISSSENNKFWLNNWFFVLYMRRVYSSIREAFISGGRIYAMFFSLRHNIHFNKSLKNE